ncbi:glycosyltransferase family 4 protein [Hydrogenibacillus sp. N12]|uniref:glycosyltransferase family 4 protein n=1 Tax=Hydrogenibacillus sp. N12 TaxID=2866627 RepID=UPI001C7E0D2A|nr:glycosyltransferase family 4 protein [Hydrogenibacillus sp. N12]QZA33876.1 glycosyltransferase family 4 protein [Hydrogenibacillus sp. N12]
MLMTKLRIGLLAPVAHRTPPDKYGPWELVVANLAQGLVELGHDVVVFATADSRPAGRLVAVVPGPLSERPDLPPRPYELIHIGHALAAADALGLDLLHNHHNYLPLPFAGLIRTPVLTTLHGAALLEPDARAAYRRFRHLPYVSISDAERAGAPELNYVATVYNGIRLDAFTPVETPGEDLVFLGRVGRVKGADLAIEVARRSGRRLILAGPVPDGEREFFETRIRPAIDGRTVEYVGEVGPKERDVLLGRAYALLHLVRAPEPFGLVLAEAQATGTPVVGFRRGAVPEVVEDGVTGFVVDTVDEAVRALERIPALDRRLIRRRAEARFSYRAMAEGYVAAYRTVLDRQSREAAGR